MNSDLRTKLIIRVFCFSKDTYAYGNVFYFSVYAYIFESCLENYALTEVLDLNGLYSTSVGNLIIIIIIIIIIMKRMLLECR